MSVRIAPSPSLPAQHDELSMYQEFANRDAAHEDEVIFSVNKTKAAAPSLKSVATQTTFQKLYRFFFGQRKRDIVQKFSTALEAKYGRAVANFAFSETQKQHALNSGLSKRLIREVINNASLACSGPDDIQAYVEMARMNIQIAQQDDSGIKMQDLHEKFQGIQDFANCQLSQFKDAADLQTALQKAIEVAATSKKLLNTQAAFQASLNATRLQHGKVMSELMKRFATDPKTLETELANFATAVVRAIQQVAPELGAFAHHINDDPSACFHLDAHGAVVIDPAVSAEPASRLTKEKVEVNQKVWHLFCNTLEACYGKPLIQRLIPDGQRQELFSSPLTVAHVKQFFGDIKHALEVDSEFLKNQPFIVDDKYYDALLANPELLQKALEAEQQVMREGTLLTQLSRKLFDIGVLAAGYHAGGVVAGGVATTFATITGVTFPIIPLTFVASTFCSFIAGKIVGSRASKDVSSFTANRAAIYTIGGTSVQIASQPFIDSLKKYLSNFFSDNLHGRADVALITFLGQFLLEEGGAIIADNLRHACIGSVVNGMNVDHIPALSHEVHPSQAADMDRRIFDLLQVIIKAADQLSPPISHEEQLRRPRIRL